MLRVKGQIHNLWHGSTVVIYAAVKIPANSDNIMLNLGDISSSNWAIKGHGGLAEQLLHGDTAGLVGRFWLLLIHSIILHSNRKVIMFTLLSALLAMKAFHIDKIQCLPKGQGNWCDNCSGLVCLNFEKSRHLIHTWMYITLGSVRSFLYSLCVQELGLEVCYSLVIHNKIFIHDLLKLCKVFIWSTNYWLLACHILHFREEKISDPSLNCCIDTQVCFSPSWSGLVNSLLEMTANDQSVCYILADVLPMISQYATFWQMYCQWSVSMLQSGRCIANDQSVCYILADVLPMISQYATVWQMYCQWSVSMLHSGRCIANDQSVCYILADVFSTNWHHQHDLGVHILY